MSGRRQTGTVSADDLEFFRRAVRDVTPINPDAKPDPAPEGSNPVPRAQSATRRRSVRIPQAAPAPAPVRLADHDRGRVPGLDRRTERRLRRGEFDIDERLDLHGKTRTDARDALVRVIVGCYACNKRCILVITGKGRPSAGDGYGVPAPASGVLRRMVPHWLSQAPVAPMIIGHAPAIAAHGGDGALYVLLRRKRET